MGSLLMIIKASGRSALMVVTGLFVCLAGGSSGLTERVQCPGSASTRDNGPIRGGPGR